MQPDEHTVTNMMWRPPLIKLMNIPMEGINNNEPTPVYIDPQLIVAVGIRNARLLDLNNVERDRISTIVWTSTQFNAAYVMETPEEVARLRDKAFGVDTPVETRSTLHAIPLKE